MKKGLAVASVVLGILSVVTLGCLGVGAVVAIGCGVVALKKARSDPAAYGGGGMAIGGIVSGGLSLVAGAIFIHALLHAKIDANEAGTIGDMRALIAAEAAYQRASGGAYGSLQCLENPRSCIPGYSGPPLIDHALAVATLRTNYRRVFHLGHTSFAYVAIPMEPGRSGERGFCGDSTGVICATADSRQPEVVDATCVVGRGCTPIR